MNAQTHYTIRTGKVSIRTTEAETAQEFAKAGCKVTAVCVGGQ